AGCLPTEAWTPRRLVRGGELDRRNVAPEILEPVEVARLGCEDVQHDVEVVREDPLRLGPRVDVPGRELRLLLQALMHLVVDRLGLAWISARGQHEVVGVAAHRAHVEDNNIPRQLLLGELSDSASLFERRQLVRNSSIATYSGYHR